MPNRQSPFHALEKDQTWRLGLLIAPAGSGKTQYLRHWAERRAKFLKIPVAWLSLSPLHNVPEYLWADLTNAFSAAGLLNNPTEKRPVPYDQRLDLEDHIIELVNVLVDFSRPISLVLDGYEAITATPIHQAVRLLIDSLPPQVQIVIAARTTPPLHQSRLRVRRQLVELGLGDLGG